MIGIIIAAYIDGSIIGMIIGISGAVVLDIILINQKDEDAMPAIKQKEKILYN